ncbi:HNH endonuclease [Burkholderia multivorans]|uniref:HNH endonuclease n=1 Tax=Burkholderia multivorans TaxID=87883 RepID=UPI00190716C0|nr:HNH endonuclease [Burkholderia multivorans]MBU9288547.1 HNH endonuclease [Burkholderia multivorans]
MASKRFRGKRCVYCGRQGISDTGDHVIARAFFPALPARESPAVPACSSCNNAKSQLEHHLLTVLPFGPAIQRPRAP